MSLEFPAARPSLFAAAGVLFSGTVTPEALKYLQRRLDDARKMRLMRLDHERPDVVSSALASAGGALEALRELGLISHEELQEWNSRFWEVITGEPLSSAPTHAEEIRTDTSVTQTVTAVAVPMPGVEVPLPPAPRFQSIGFRRLIRGPDEEKAFGPGLLRILALIVYEDGVEVDWLFSLPPNVDTFAAERGAVAQELDALPRDEQVRRLQDRDRQLRWHATPREFALSDDTGTAYERQGGGAHGGFVTIRGQQGFSPTIPREATEIYVDADGVRFAVTVA
jgi:hypothetical protein